MAESLREEICLKRWRDLAGVSRDEQWSWEQAKLNAPMSTKSVLQEYDFYASEFLAKVDKALLARKDVLKIDREKIDKSDYYLEWLKDENSRMDYRDWRIAKAQLQAIKDILEGE